MAIALHPCLAWFLKKIGLLLNIRSWRGSWSTALEIAWILLCLVLAQYRLVMKSYLIYGSLSSGRKSSNGLCMVVLASVCAFVGCGRDALLCGIKRKISGFDVAGCLQRHSSFYCVGICDEKVGVDHFCLQGRPYQNLGQWWETAKSAAFKKLEKTNENLEH